MSSMNESDHERGVGEAQSETNAARRNQRARQDRSLRESPYVARTCHVALIAF